MRGQPRLQDRQHPSAPAGSQSGRNSDGPTKLTNHHYPKSITVMGSRLRNEIMADDDKPDSGSSPVTNGPPTAIGPLDDEDLDDDEDDDISIDSQLGWELDEGIPQPYDEFIQKYMAGRSALIAQEKKQRHDALFKATMSPLAKRAARIMSRIRRRELREKWSAEYEESLAEKNGGNLYPGMMFTLARERMEGTVLWRVLERMPKGALLHAHLDAMVDVDWMVEQIFEEGMCVHAPGGLRAEQMDDAISGRASNVQFRFYKADAEEMVEARTVKSEGRNIWTEGYQAMTPVPLKEAAAMYPNGGEAGFKKWLWSRCVITPEESLFHHHGLDAIWRKFQSCFPNIGWMLYYEPIFRKGLQRLFTQLAEDGITYVDLRCAFMLEFRRTGESHVRESDGLNGLGGWFEVFGEEVEKFTRSELGQKVKFQGARMIWTVIRTLGNRQMVPFMKECIRIKKLFPHLVCGFDFVAQEDMGRPLKDLTPLVFWFRKQCMEEGVDLPFFFHAGECLGDGDETDSNLFDAVLLGTRRIGHGYSLYKHPLLIDMVKQKKILVESCPISNEILRLSSSILGHSLPALLSRGVACSLNNDDPAILGHGKNGLTHDFWQSFMAFENLGLEGLGAMAENSLKWCAVEDQKPGEWLRGIDEGYRGKGIRGQMLKDWRHEFEQFCQWVILEFVDEDESSDDDELG